MRKNESLYFEIKLHHGRGEVPFPFRRAPGGLAMRRYRVRFHHAAAAAQSYRRSYELPASLANNGQRDALATTSSARHRDFVQGSHPPLHVSGPDHLQTRLQMSCSPSVDDEHYQTPVCEDPPPPRTPRCLLTCRSTQVMAASTRQRPRVAA